MYLRLVPVGDYFSRFGRGAKVRTRSLKGTQCCVVLVYLVLASTRLVNRTKDLQRGEGQCAKQNERRLAPFSIRQEQVDPVQKSGCPVGPQGVPVGP